MTKETVKNLQDAKGKFEIEVDGFGVKFTVVNCNGAAWLIAIFSMVNRLSNATDLSYETISNMIAELADSAKAFECESKEQLDVMNEIYRKNIEQ